jgi:hypothetical protein
MNRSETTNMLIKNIHQRPVEYIPIYSCIERTNYITSVSKLKSKLPLQFSKFFAKGLNLLNIVAGKVYTLIMLSVMWR